GRPVPGGDPLPLQAAPQLGRARGSRPRVRGHEPALRRPAQGHAQRGRGRQGLRRALRRPRLRDLAGRGLHGLRRARRDGRGRAGQARPLLRPGSPRDPDLRDAHEVRAALPEGHQVGGPGRRRRVGARHAAERGGGAL
ncbi:MAG: Putative iron-sulfur cluster assembly scaffold protein for SUF system, SufE2, partial [uncultured Solirubrobacteraceae bacterium]